MAMGHLIVGLLLLGAWSQVFAGPGKEYEYEAAFRVGVGTRDYVPHASGMGLKFKARMQIESETTIRAEVSDMRRTLYVGKLPRESEPVYESFPQKLQFVANLENGVVKSVAYPAGLTLSQRNIVKGLAATLQVNHATRADDPSFKSKEQTVHGECEVSYLVTSDTITKTVHHDRDCKDRVVRRIDDVRGHDCDWEDKGKADGLVSVSNTIYTYEKEGSERKITKIQVNGAFIAQMFEAEGVSHIALSNGTFNLVDVRDISDAIQGGSELTNSLAHEFADSHYKWNVDRDLKAAEPLISSGLDVDASQDELKESLIALLAKQMELLNAHDADAEAVDCAHKHGIENVRFPMKAMNYDTLMSIYDQLRGDKSEDGVRKANIFTELLGSTGTTASAMVVLDLDKAKKFDNARDAARVLTSVPFHIRRPNTQLVKEFESLLDADEESVVEMAIPLMFGHLVRITCERAGNPMSPQQLECYKDLGKKWTEDFLAKFKSATSRDTRNLYLYAITNIRHGGHMDLLKPLVYGEMEGVSSEERVAGVWAVMWDVAMHHKAMDYYFPVFAERKNGHHEVRIAALQAIMNMKPSTTDIGKVVAILRTETDYDVINVAFTLLESKANSISPCDRKVRESSRFFLKYLKQFSSFHTDMGFGVSKNYVRQFNQKKYGYGGSYSYYCTGAHDSATPLSVSMAISSYTHHNYLNNFLFVHLRIEGVAKALIKKFKTMDPATWKTADLAAILNSDMNIKERPDQPIRAQVAIVLKGTVVISRSYDDSDTQGGKLSSFLEKFQSLGSEYSINHQRVIQLGQLDVEQPIEGGFSVMYKATATNLFSIKADIERGNNRGLMFRNVEYLIHSFTQSQNAMYLFLPDSKLVHKVVQDRVYHAHLPRKIVIGVNPIRKELKLSLSRAKYDDPTMLMMHSRTKVLVRSNTLTGDVPALKKFCPTCDAEVEVSAGDHAVKTRKIVDVESEKYGLRLKADYFDCEMNVARGNTVGRIVGAFMPYNKNPRTPWTMLTMGIRQLRAYLFYYPRAEKCGIMAKWSQSKVNPVREIMISVRVTKSANGERLFLRGSHVLVQINVQAKGDQTRAYRLTLSKKSTPGDLNNEIKVKFNRAKAAALGIEPYSVCLTYQNKYPPFGKEMMNVDMDETLKMEGEALLQYGEGTKCSAGQGEIKTDFVYSTTQEARESLKNKWYYKDCMKLKASEAWKGRDGLPLSDTCYMMAHDASSARKYQYNIKFQKLTDRMKNIIGKFRGLVSTFLLQFYNIDQVDDNDVGAFMNIGVTIKDDDNLADVVLETSQGTKKISDYGLKFDWAKRLRNLKFSSMAYKLKKMGVIKMCQATSKYVQTMDNVTYSSDAPSCWTLMSGHCGPSPSYAVFIKKSSGKFPLAMKAYVGGHLVEIDPTSNSVKIDGTSEEVTDSEEHKHMVNNVEVLKVNKWGSTYNIYSFLRVLVAFDGNFVNVVPAPSVTGQHCGLCGNYNRNQFDEHTGKDGVSLIPGGLSQMAEEWKWNC